MSGIMRAPSRGVSFAVPYSGKLEIGDIILVISTSQCPSIAAYYRGNIGLVYEDSIIDFSDENNVITFKALSIVDAGYAAFIPGPKHV